MNIRFGAWGTALAWMIAASPVLAAESAATDAAATETPSKPSAVQTAEMMPMVAKRSLMLDITDAASRGIIVGERGHILVSESRSDWRQVEGVPTRATLTAVTSVGDKAWAVGHDGVILHSADGGLTWTVQRRDRSEVSAEEVSYEDYDPQAGAPLLDVSFKDAQSGFAIGAFSLILRTDDGGATWSKIDISPDQSEDEAEETAAPTTDDSWTFDEADLALEEEDDPHLNGMTRTGSGLLVIVGERGAAFRSRDDGVTWERLQLPYAGSMFGVLALGDEHVLAYGLRGHVLESRDGGDTWQELDTTVELSLMGGAALPDGGFVVVGSNGVVVRRESADGPVLHDTYSNEASETPVLAAVLPLGTRTFLVCGDKGMGRFQAGK